VAIRQLAGIACSLAAGAACASAPGADPCGDKLACVAHGDPQQGRCEYWCNVSDPYPCTSGSCITFMDTNGVTLSFCE
jgi:hypothetical protein